jgi:uncharacterized protein
MTKYIVVLALLVLRASPAAAQVLRTPNVRAQLYLGDADRQPLIVGLGGAEGGNAWSSDRWKATRDALVQRGYAFLAVGYFGGPGTPAILDRIAIDQVHDAIVAAARNPRIDRRKIAIIGGSRGADLALLIGAHYPDITCVVGIVPSHVAFPGHTQSFTTSAWTFQGKELPFVPVSEAAVPFLRKRDLRAAFETMLRDTRAEARAAIPVERINGPILLLSATRDEIAPSTPMAEKLIARLKAKRFKHHHEHVAVAGGHAEPLAHFDKVFAFLDDHWPR